MAPRPTTLPARDRRPRWTDERLDDLAGEVRALRELPQAVARLAVEQSHVREDVRSLTAACDAVAVEMRTGFARSRAVVRNVLVAFVAPIVAGGVVAGFVELVR